MDRQTLEVKPLNFLLIHQLSKSATKYGMHHWIPQSDNTADQMDQEKGQCSKTWLADSTAELQRVQEVDTLEPRMPRL